MTKTISATMTKLKRFMFPPTCTMMIGVPGAGKSTWIKHHVPSNVKVLSLDAICEDIARRMNTSFTEVTNDEKLNFYAKMLVGAELDVLLENRTDFVWDQVNVNTGIREPMIRLLHEYGFRVEAVAFFPPVTKFQRNKVFERNRHGVEREVWESMVDEFELPAVWEGFSERTFIPLPEFHKTLRDHTPTQSGWNL